MGNALDRLLKKKGHDRSTFKKNSKLGKIFRNSGVANSAELQRILELPEYRWQDDTSLGEVAAYLKELHGLPPRECEETCACRGAGDMELRPIQAAALMNIHDFGGLLGPIRVGGGKTLISFLVGTVCDAERVMLLIPAKLKKKTLREFAKLARHWKKPPRMHIMTYELLSRDRGLDELNAFRPDLIVADEAHKLKNPRAACTKRVRKYFSDVNPEARYLDMSGTMTQRSIMEFYHRQAWALPENIRPLPRNYNETRDWADALDEKVSPTGRLMPGALYQFCSEEELKSAGKDTSKKNQIKIARQAFQRRLMSAPGVVGTEEMFDGAMSISLEGVSWDVGPAVVEAFERLRETWELPDGHPIDEPSALWMAARCLIQGFYYRWDPAPPEDWLQARKAWGQIVRQILKDHRDIDSPLGVSRAIEEGRFAWAKGPYQDWRFLRPTFKPKTKAFWIDDGAFNYCTKWAKKNKGILWVNEVAMGQRLYKEAGIPYYGSQGLCGKKMIEDETGSCAASIKANSEGRNLQYNFNKNFVVSPPPAGAVWEQMLGRTHREGQPEDEVTVEVALGCYENWKVMMQALRDAEYQERTIGQSQKLNFADLDIPSPEEVKTLSSQSPLWSKHNADFFDEDSKGWNENDLALGALTVKERAARRKDAYAGLSA